MDALIAAARRRHPEWQGVIDAMRETATAAAAPQWTEAAERARLAAPRAADAPILDGAEIPVPAHALARLLAIIGDGRRTPEEALGLVQAAIEHEETSARAVFAAQPLLRACARVHRERVPPHWPHGYCPVCGAWPVLSELVGIDRARQLRCGRCAAGWTTSWLMCPYCGERAHDRLGRLVPEASRETRFIETCGACGGYIKTLATLLPSSAVELALKDLDTVELDLAALEHGLARPGDPGYGISVRLIA